MGTSMNEILASPLVTREVLPWRCVANRGETPGRAAPPVQCLRQEQEQPPSISYPNSHFDRATA